MREAPQGDLQVLQEAEAEPGDLDVGRHLVQMPAIQPGRTLRKSQGPGKVPTNSYPIGCTPVIFLANAK